MDNIKIISESQNETIVGLTQLIGAKATLEIIKLYGGSHIYIPLFATLASKERNIKIYEEYKNGANYRSIAIKYALSEVTIRNIIKSEIKKEVMKSG